MEELHDAYKKVKGSPFGNRRKLVWLIAWSCLGAAVVLNECHEAKKEDTYHQLLIQQKYEQAILYQSDDIRAYQEYLEQAYQKDQIIGKTAALQNIKLIYASYPLEMKSDVAAFLIQECILTKDVKQLEYAVELMKNLDEDAIEKEYLPIVTAIVQGKQAVSMLEKRYQELSSSTESEQIDILTALYEMQEINKEESYVTLISLYEKQQDRYKKQQLQYAYGLWLCEKRQENALPYVQTLEQEWKDSAYHFYLGNLYMEVFESCVEDEQKRNHMDLLEKAQQYFEEMEQEQQSKEVSLRQITYLKEKWR